MKKIQLLLFLFVGFFGFSQTEISGTVVDGDGNPVIGATVRSDQVPTEGTITDVDGRFVLSLSDATTSVSASYVGVIQTFQVDGRSSYNFTIVDNSIVGVVITGFGEKDIKDVTGSYDRVEGEVFEQSQFATVGEALQGQSAGLNVISPNGTPGAAPTIILRGVSSLTAGIQPLWVIDGVPVDVGDLSGLTSTSSVLASLDPNSIESIEVLKDASATAIYGSRGANGVILVTTKRGVKGATQISMNTEWGFQNEAFNELEVMNAQQFIELTALGRLNAGLDPDIETARNSAASFHNWDGQTSTDWGEEVRGSALINDNNISIRGGGEKTKFSITGGYNQQQPLIQNSSFERYSAGINVNHRATEKLNVNLSMNGSFFNQEAPSFGGSFRNPLLNSVLFSPTSRPRNEDGSYNFDNRSLIAGNGATNPITYFEDEEVNRTMTNIASATVNYDLLDNLTITSQFSTNFNNVEEFRFWNPNYGDGLNVSGRRGETSRRRFVWNLKNYLSYNTDIVDKILDVSTTVGYESNRSDTRLIFAEVTNFSTDRIRVAAGGADLDGVSGNNFINAFAGVFGTAQFGLFEGRYNLDATFRRDGSSRFGPENRHGNFWSLGASWNVTDEKFMENLEVFDRLKLRGSYGVTGNAEIGSYPWQASWDAGRNSGANPGSQIQNVPNESLAWETTNSTTIGLDFGLFESLTGSVEWYNNDTEDLLFSRPLSRASGYTSVLDNVAALRNRGVEVSLDYTPVQTESLTWSVSGTFAHNNNEVVALVGDLDESPAAGRKVLTIGEDVNSWFLRDWAGVDASNGDPLWYTDASRTQTTNDINEAARFIQGTSLAPTTASLTNNLSYNGFTLSAMLWYAGGHEVFDNWGFVYDTSGEFANENKRVELLNNTWTETNTNAKYPRYVAGRTGSNGVSTRYLYEGDFVRLRNLRLQYDFDNGLTETFKIQRLSLYFVGQNLATWVKDDDLYFDPETGANGIFNLTVPNMRTFSLGTNINF